MDHSKLSMVGLVGVVFGYLVLGILYANNTPPWQAPDEPAHFNYIAQVASDGCCPIIAEGDYDFDYLEELKATQFPDDADVSVIEYEDHQPPLYYIMGAQVYQRSDGDLTAQRIFSVALGAILIIVSYFIIVKIFPTLPTLALATAMVVAFIPQHIAIHASVNNDSLAELTLALVLLGSVVYIYADLVDQRFAAALGLLAGLTFLTKLTVHLPAVFAVAGVIVLRTRSDNHSFGWFFKQGLAAALPALVLGAFWWVRNAVTYGFPDITGLGAHGDVVTGQPTTASFISGQGALPYLSSFFRTLFNSFWGQFGWMGVPMPRRVYQGIILFLLIAIVGGSLLVARKGLTLSTKQKQSLIVLIAVTIATVTGLLVYNLTFAQAQGRYLYPALIPLALFTVLGLYGWVIMLRQLVPERLQGILDWLPIAFLLWMPALSLYALFRFIVPNLG